MFVSSEDRVRELIDRAIASPNQDDFSLIMAELRSVLQQHIRQARDLILASYYSKTSAKTEQVLMADAKQRIQARDRNSKNSESPPQDKSLPAIEGAGS